LAQYSLTINIHYFLQELVDGKSTSGSHLTDQQNILGETESTIKMPQVNTVTQTK